MSLEGVFTDGIVFARMDPDSAYSKLAHKKKTWLIRESRVDYCLTLDFRQNGEAGSLRFGLKPSADMKSFIWEDKTDIESLEEVADLIDPNTLNSDEIKAQVKQLMTLIEKLKGFNNQEMLLPTKDEQTRHALYSKYPKVWVTQNQQQKLPPPSVTLKKRKREEASDPCDIKEKNDQLTEMSEAQKQAATFLVTKLLPFIQQGKLKELLSSSPSVQPSPSDSEKQENRTDEEGQELKHKKRKI